MPETLRLARVWAALAGGDLTDADSRDLAARIEQRYPGIRDDVRDTRRFHSTEARRAVADGALLVIFAAAGLPVDPELHLEAARENPRARFIYADPDETVTLLRRARCGPQCEAVQASALDPEALLRLAAPAGLSGPVHVQVIRAATYWPEETARKAITRWADLLPSRSSLALSVSTGGRDGRPGNLLDGIARVQTHTAASVRAWLEDAGLRVTEPGVVPVRTWPAAAVGVRDGGAWQISAAAAVRD